MINAESFSETLVPFHQTPRYYIPWDSNVTTSLLPTSLQKKRVGWKQRLTWRHILSFTFMTSCWIIVGGYQCFEAIFQAWSEPSLENDSSILQDRLFWFMPHQHSCHFPNQDHSNTDSIRNLVKFQIVPEHNLGSPHEKQNNRAMNS
jgi:hypothetical protein